MKWLGRSLDIPTRALFPKLIPLHISMSSGNVDICLCNSLARRPKRELLLVKIETADEGGDLWIYDWHAATLSHSALVCFFHFCFIAELFFLLPEKHSTSWGINQSMVLLVTLSTGKKRWSKHPLSGWGPAKSNRVSHLMDYSQLD